LVIGKAHTERIAELKELIAKVDADRIRQEQEEADKQEPETE
jgi:hypothetical protein